MGFLRSTPKWKKYNPDLLLQLEVITRTKVIVTTRNSAILKKCTFFRDNKVFMGSHKLYEIKKVINHRWG